MPVPRVKTQSTGVQSPRSRCGDNWDKNIKVRNPYRGLNRYFRNMLSLAEADRVQARDEELPAQLRLERARVRKLRGDLERDLTLDQRRNIDRYLTNAGIYLEDAEKIQKQWSLGFATANYGDVEPLSIRFQPPPGTKYEVMRGHEKDASKWTALVLAALKNIRCAEEVIRKTEVLKLNKAAWDAEVAASVAR